MSTTTTTHVGAFPEPPRRVHHSHEQIGDLFSYDAYKARAEALNEARCGAYTFSELEQEALRCAAAANEIATQYAWPTVDVDRIAPSFIVTGHETRTSGSGKHRAPEPDTDGGPSTAGQEIILAPRVDDTQLLPAVAA